MKAGPIISGRWFITGKPLGALITALQTCVSSAQITVCALESWRVLCLSTFSLLLFPPTFPILAKKYRHVD